MQEPTTVAGEGLTPLAPRRIAGVALDGLVLAFCVQIFPVGLVVAPLYLVFGMKRRTLGHRVAGLRVVMRDATPLDLRRAALRALPIGTLVILASFPVWGAQLFVLGALAWAVVEAWLYRDGWRLGLGDLMAGTATVRRPPRVEPAPPAAPA
jgi:uncharacterized RDD family membrane protein YckC